MLFNIIHSGYLLGYLSGDKIVNWADEQILKGNLNDQIMELSVSLNNKNKFLAILSSLTDKTFTEIPDYYYSLYHFLFKKKLLDENDIGQEMLKLCYYNIVTPDDIIHMDLSILSNYFDLKKHGLPLPFNLSFQLSRFLDDYNKDIQIFKDLKFNVLGIQIDHCM